jgi:predicted lactoylglutathione lyase
MIFVNLSVKDIAAARSFFTGLGFRFDPDYSDDQAACLVVDRNIFVMLLAEDRFRALVPGEVAGRGTTEVLTSLSVDSREEVDRIVARAVASGGRPWLPPVQDGPMYGHSFQDPDGHVWELVHVAPPTGDPPAV